MQWLRDKVPAKAKKAYAGPGRVLSFCRDDTRVAAHLRIILVYYRNSFHESARGATSSIVCRICVTSYLNPRPMRGGRTRTTPETSSPSRFQSTPPCAGGDNSARVACVVFLISIHAPLRGGRLSSSCVYTHILNFNPRPPARGATPLVSDFWMLSEYFNPRPPARGATYNISA